jgi:hypothetical protein
MHQDSQKGEQNVKIVKFSDCTLLLQLPSLWLQDLFASVALGVLALSGISAAS